MKNFFLSALIMLMCVSGGVAQAVNHSTQENFNFVFQICTSAINETADYYDVLKKGNDNVIDLRRRYCKVTEETLSDFMHNSAQGAESKVCVLDTISIIQGRGLILSYYLSAMNAYRAGNMALYEEYRQLLQKSFNEAERDRQNFKAKYGY